MGDATSKRSDIKVDVWNKALDRIGQTDVIEEEGEVRLAAAVCRRHYDDCVEEALELRAFPWAGQQCTPTPLATTRVGWAYTYTLPPDFIQARAIISGNTRYSLTPGEEQIPYELQADDAGEGQVLCTDYLFDTEDALEYTTRVTNVGAWPRLFVSAIAFRLAVELALAIPKKPDLARAMSDSFEVTLARAYSASLNQQRADQPLEAESIRARQ